MTTTPVSLPAGIEVPALGEPAVVAGLEAFELLESQVRFYSRHWPTVFSRAAGSYMYDEHGIAYLDFFAGAGSVNLGHNPPVIIDALIDHLRCGGLINGLDMATTAKRAFLEALTTLVLFPRGLHYRVQFTGPGGTNAVEAALRLARKVTGRDRIVALSGAFHGMTLGSTSVSDMPHLAGVPRVGEAVTRVPHEDDAESAGEAIAALRSAFAADAEPPAALILEVVQGEGGARPLSGEYLVAAQELCVAHDALLIVDDIQAGCGRTGYFFSFEQAGIQPDLICLSKSISGVGLPLSLLLVRPAADVWEPGEFSGTFRGNTLAFVAGRVALEGWWRDTCLQAGVRRKSEWLTDALTELASSTHPSRQWRGRGLMLGIPCADRTAAMRIATRCFRRGLLVETCGRDGAVIKLLPPLTVEEDELQAAMAILAYAIKA